MRSGPALKLAQLKPGAATSHPCASRPGERRSRPDDGQDRDTAWCNEIERIVVGDAPK